MAADKKGSKKADKEAATKDSKKAKYPNTKTETPEAAAKTPEATPDAARPSLPLFYSDPHALTVERHGSKAIMTNADYSFAKDTNSVPMTAMEFSQAVRHYPIVFSAAAPVVPVAVLGLSGARNQFVSGEDGAWRAKTYIPAYVRRYPFILMESPDKLQFTLCIDEAASHYGDEGNSLFEGDEASEICKKALEFCSTYQGQHSFTLEFTATLEKYGLLVDNQAALTLTTGEKISLSGFRVIDEEKFTNLPDDVFLEWRKRGWIPLVYCHLLSMSNWQPMGDEIVSERNAAGTS